MLVVDRVEGDYVVVEFEEQYLNIPLTYFIEDVKEGDILELRVNKEKTQNVRKNNKERLERLFKLKQENRL